MAEKRNSPYIWVSWLAEIMSGDLSCHWKVWFKTHNKLTKKQSSDFDSVAWKINHTKKLTEVKDRLIKNNQNPKLEKYIEYKIPNSNAIIQGRIDCAIETEDTITIYECKTGKERDSDQAQVMLYMYILSKNSKKQIKGIISYNDKEIEIILPENFEENFNFFVNKLISIECPIKNPGNDCRFCDITKEDCPERI